MTFAQDEMMPLSNTQRLLWAATQNDELEILNIVFTIHILGPIDIRALELALGDVIQRHHILRISVHNDTEQMSQSYVHTTNRRIKLTTIKTGIESVAKVFQSRSRRFILHEELPLEAHLLITSSELHILLLTVHPLVADSWSVGPLLKDLCCAYHYRCSGIAPRWPILELQYVDYLSWYQTMSKNRCAVTLSKRFLKDSERPALASFPELQNSNYYPTHLHLNPGLHRRLLAVQTATGTTPLMTLHAVVALTIAKLWGLETFTVSAEMPGRGHRPFGHLIGPIANRLFLQVDIRKADTFRSLLSSIYVKHLEAYKNADVEWGDIVNAGDNIYTSMNGPATVMISCQKYVRRAITHDVQGCRFIAKPVFPFMADCDLAFDLVELGYTDGVPEGIDVKIRSNRKSFNKNMLPAVSSCFLDIFRAVLFDPDIALAALIDSSSHLAITSTRDSKECRYHTSSIDPISTRVMPQPTVSLPPSRQSIQSVQYIQSEHTTQTRLVEIWEDTLKLRRIGIFDDLIDLGGTQKLFNEILEKITDAYEIHLPSKSVVPGITIAGLSQDLIEKIPRAPMIQINAGNPQRKNPLWFLHGDIGGHGLYCYELRRFLNSDRPFYALPPHGINGNDAPYSI